MPSRDNLAGLAKLTERDGERLRLGSGPPLMIQVPDLWKLNLGGQAAGTGSVSCASAGSCAAGGT